MTTERDVFALEAAAYEAWYETPEGRRADALEKELLGGLLRRCFDGPLRALEVGCGTGHFTRWLQQQGLTAVGLDRSDVMLAQARALDGTTLLRGDGLALPLADRSVDLVAFITSLEFVDDPRQALSEALRVARQGLLLGVLNRNSWMGLRRRWASRSQETVYDAAHFYGVGELRRLVGAAAGPEAQIAWRTTLFPRCCPWREAHLPWGGFIGVAVRTQPFRHGRV